MVLIFLLNHPFYLLDFENPSVCSLNQRVIKSDLEPDCEEFVKFSIVEDTDVDLTPSHHWKLKIYEQVGNVNLDPTLATLLHIEDIFVTPETSCN